MKLIPLSQQGKNKGKYSVMVDDADFEWLNQWRWTAQKGNSKSGVFYAQRSAKKGVASIKMHRLIMGEPWGVLIDHEDGNGLNCQRYNLRTATNSQNGANRRSGKGGTSEYLGVYWRNRGKRWTVEIQKNGVKKYIGQFVNEADAAMAYNAAALKYHGEFANLNVID